MSKTNRTFEELKRGLCRKPKTWLVTGCAGFIGSHLVENLLRLRQRVVGLEHFATGSQKNLNAIRKAVGPVAWRRFRLVRGDITKLSDCLKAFGRNPSQFAAHPRKKKTGSPNSRIDIILHQAGLGSVPRSIADPLVTHHVNVTGTLNLLVAARDAGVRRFVYASSSAVYGDVNSLSNREISLGPPLSPYAASKQIDELYAKAFGKCYGMETIGLRYFNVFGPRQDPKGAYAAVIPRWIGEIGERKTNVIYGDGKTSRDFVYVNEVVQSNLRAGVTRNKSAMNEVFNVARGKDTTLNELHKIICAAFRGDSPIWQIRRPVHRPLRAGDIRRSRANITKGRKLLNFRPTVSFNEGIKKTVTSCLQGLK